LANNGIHWQHPIRARRPESSLVFALVKVPAGWLEPTVLLLFSSVSLPEFFSLSFKSASPAAKLLNDTQLYSGTILFLNPDALPSSQPVEFEGLDPCAHGCAVKASPAGKLAMG